MKKIISLLVMFILGFTMVSCQEDKNFQVDVFIYKFSDTYIGGVRTEMEKQLKELDNVTYTFHDADGQQDTQSTQIDTAITAGSDLLIVNIVETASGQTIVDKAKTANLPIIFFNREISDAVVKSYSKAAFVGTDPDEAGYMQGEMIAEILLAAGNYDKYDRNDDGKISYVMLRADLDNPEANGRTTYSVQEANRLLQVGGKPALVQIGTDTNAEWDLAKAKTAMDSFLVSNPLDGTNPIELVIANNDDMALGAVSSLKEKDFNKGTDETKTILVVGVDATATAVDAINNNQMAGSIKQDGIAMATCLIKFAKNAVDGKAYTEGTTYTYETGVNKVRIPYAKYTG